MGLSVVLTTVGVLSTGDVLKEVSKASCNTVGQRGKCRCN